MKGRPPKKIFGIESNDDYLDISNPYKRLAVGIVRQALLDYKILREDAYIKRKIPFAVKQHMNCLNLQDVQRKLMEIEEFLYSDWCAFLLDTEPQTIPRILRQRYRYLLTDVYRKKSRQIEEGVLEKELFDEISEILEPDKGDIIKFIIQSYLKGKRRR